MADTREKLIDLLMDMPSGNSTYEEEKRHMEAVADYLIENGATFATDNNVGSLISVTDEHKPKQFQECLCVCAFDDDPKREWRFFNVLKWHDVPYQDNGIVNRPHFTDEGVQGMVVTHWMPLPPLPEPPKGE